MALNLKKGNASKHMQLRRKKPGMERLDRNDQPAADGKALRVVALSVKATGTSNFR